MKRLRVLLPLLMALVLLLTFSVPAYAATSNTITITGTPAYIEITTNVNTWTINGITGSGYMSNNTTYYSNPGGDTVAPSATVVDGECRFDTTNGGNIAIDLSVNIPDFTGGDASTNSNLGTNDTTKFGAYTYVSGVAFASKVIAKASGSSVSISNLAAAADKYWGIMLTTQSNAWTSATAMSSSCTISAVAH